MTDRRRRLQLVEIADLLAAGRQERAAGLALVHLAEFPDDAERISRLAEGTGVVP